MLALNELRDRLRRLADDCEERAYRSDNGYARNLYHVTASDCRRAIRAPGGPRHDALAAMTAQAHVARWYDGEDVPELSAVQSAKPEPKPALRAVRTPIESLLNPRQLAQRFGMSERGARKAIERGWKRSLAGFHRDGVLWFAEPHAFAQVRR